MSTLVLRNPRFCFVARGNSQMHYSSACSVASPGRLRPELGESTYNLATEASGMAGT